MFVCFFQAEDGIRDIGVTGVQTCALPILVFGATDPKGGAAGGAMNLLQFPMLNHRCEITGGIREADCRGLLQKFFARQRLSEKSEKKNGNDDPDSSGRNL